MRKHQEGYIWRKGDSWFGRWWEDVIVNGQIVRKQKAQKLAPYCDRYRTERDVRPLLEEILRPINEERAKPESTLTVADFVHCYYLPFAKENCRPSTYSAYKTQWEMYLASRLTKTILRDFRTVDAGNLLADIHRCHELSRSTLRHLKAFMSSAFSFAKNQGILDGVNPVQDAMIPRKATPPKETHASTAEEVLSVMDVLQSAGEMKACVAVALMFFAGLRPGEAPGARWEDYDGKKLYVRRSIWRTHESEPKTAAASKPVPVIDPLRSLLSDLRIKEGNPASGPILQGHSGRPLNLDNVAKRIVRPILEKGGIEWHGWYSLRRGIATLLNSVEKDAMAAKGLLRHASVLTTQKHYIKEVPEITTKAMEKVEALCTNRATAEGSEFN